MAEQMTSAAAGTRERSAAVSPPASVRGERSSRPTSLCDQLAEGTMLAPRGVEVLG
ncbi:MAG TPA: hypothetical protein VK605_08215 [Solirubrobacteraceae bacterium]|nr:hypothetical protein [Solirubrobacteraceae bacterium]